jgi:hypothetical protein
MFLSETVARAIHADRIRDLERAAHDHRLLAAVDESASVRPMSKVRSEAPAARPARGDSAGQPA